MNSPTQTFMKAVRALTLAASSIASLAVCSAQELTVTISPQTKTASPGDLVSFAGTIRNDTATTLFLNGERITTSLLGFPILPVTFDLHFNEQPFVTNAPTQLAPGAEWTGELFQVTVGLDAPVATFDSVFTVQGGLDNTPYGAIGSSNFHLTVLGAARTAGPAAPTTLTATDGGVNVALAWTDLATNEDGYSVEQSPDGIAYSVIATLGADRAHYIVTTPLPLASYFFRVRAFNHFDTLTYSSYSNTVEFTHPLPPTPGTGDGLAAAYFNDVNNNHLSGTPALKRVDATINFDLGDGGPGAPITPDHFSARWTGKVQPQFSQTYNFYTMSDDGVRLWVNDVLLIDNWTDHAPTENSGSITLVAGQVYSIKMELFENVGQTTAQLSWESPSTPKQIIPKGQLYSGTVPTALVASGGQNQITLTWNAPFDATDAASRTYNVYRGTSAGSQSLVPIVTGLTTPTYVDTGRTNQQTYYYYVKAVIPAYESTASNEASAVPHPTFATYQNQYFTPAQIADPAISGPMVAPPGGNGLLNLVAYAFDESPWSSTTTHLPRVTNSGNNFEMTFVRRKGVSDVTYEVQVSPDLGTPTAWQSGPAFTSQVSTAPINADTEWATFRDNDPISPANPTGFMRVKVLLSP